MEALFAALEQAFGAYRSDVEAFERKRRPTDGLLGFGRSLRDDSCNDRFDAAVAQAVEAIRAASPSPDEAGRVVRLLLLRDDADAWPLAAQWMLQAVERHSLPLIPFLSPEAAKALLGAYTARYRPWDRLPAQKAVVKALKERAQAVARAGREGVRV